MDPDAPERSDVLRCLTWNLWWRFGDRRRRFAALRSVLQDVDPDVCGLQQVWADADSNAAALLAEDLGMLVLVDAWRYADPAAPGWTWDRVNPHVLATRRAERTHRPRPRRAAGSGRAGAGPSGRAGRGRPGGRRVALGLASLVGLSRIYVGAHLPLDVAGGAALGLLVDGACSGLRRREVAG